MIERRLAMGEQSVQPEPRATRFLKSELVGRGPVNRGVELNRFVSIKS